MTDSCKHSSLLRYRSGKKFMAKAGGKDYRDILSLNLRNLDFMTIIKFNTIVSKCAFHFNPSLMFVRKPGQESTLRIF